MKRIIIADIKSFNNSGKSTGHYYRVAQNYIDLYSEFCDVKIAGGYIYSKRFENNQLLKLPYETKINRSKIINLLNVLKNAYFLFKRVSDKDVVIMQKSGTLTMFLAIALFANTKNNIFFIEYDTEALKSPLGKFIYSIAKKKINGIICPNEIISKAYGIPSCIVTDYIYSKKDKKNDIDFSKKQYDFCVIGSIWPDKGVVEVAQKFKNTSYKLVIAGKPCNEIIEKELNYIVRNSPNIKLHLGYISDTDYNNYIVNSKYCILNYRGCYNDRSSGVILDILFNRVPVIACRCNATLFLEEENIGYLYNNLEEFNPAHVMNEKTYNNYLKGINNFLIKQDKYREKVISFLGVL